MMSVRLRGDGLYGDAGDDGGDMAATRVVSSLPEVLDLV